MQVLTETWRSSAIGRQKSVTVALPPSYSRTGRPFPVVYLLHGYGGNRHTWLASVDLADDLARLRFIAVFPECGRYWFIDDAGGRCYERYLVDEVVSYIDANFNTAATRGKRAVAGFSMGGASALFQALRHPDVFSVVGSHGGAFEAPFREGDPYRAERSNPRFLMPTVREHERVWGPVGSPVRRTYDPYRLLDRRDPSLSLSVYCDIGSEDHVRMLTMNRNMRDAFVAAGVDHDYREGPGGHDWEFVRAGAPTMLAFIGDAIGAA